jgi:amino acid transporter
MLSRSPRRGVQFVSLLVAVLSFATVLANFMFQQFVLMAASGVVTAYALMLAGDAYLQDLRDAVAGKDEDSAARRP